MPDVRDVETEVEQFHAQLVARWPNAAQLSKDELKRRFPQRPELRVAWRLPADLPDIEHELIVAIDVHFPWTLPLIAVPEALNGIASPHIERDGRICAVPSSAVYELPVGVRHVEALIGDATQILRQGSERTNDDDFFREARSYWSLIEPHRGAVWVLQPPGAMNELWYSAQSGNNAVLGPSAASIRDWSINSRHSTGPIEPALVLKLDAPLHPENYPLTPKDVIDLADKLGATSTLRRAVESWRFRGPLMVLLHFAHEGKTILLGAELPIPGQVILPGARHPGIPGFRPTARGATARLKMLRQIPLRFRHWRATPVYRNYLRDRTAGIAARPLDKCHVAIIGCGALGGQLAVQLLQAGVGKLTLIDSQLLVWQNVGRHVLDGTFVGRDKAEALRDVLLRRFPDADVAEYTRTWEEQYGVSPDVLEAADLIISATAEPASNLHLDSLSENSAIGPVMFCWMEAYGAAAHAVFRHPGQPGLCDVTDVCGLLKEPVVDRDSAPQLPQEASCGAFYQPYSSLSALSSVVLAGELAVDVLLGRVSRSMSRTWVGDASMFHEQGLAITPAWHNRITREGFSRRYDQPIFPR